MTELASAETRVSVAGFESGAAGVTPPSDPARRGVFLTDVVVELGFADRETVDAAAQAASQAGKPVERYLLDSGVLDEDQLSFAIAERNGLDHVDLDRFEVDMGVAEMIGRKAALRYCAVPIAVASDGALILAVEDPFDSLGISDIEVMTRSEVRPVIATASGIGRLVEQLPDEPPAKISLPEPEPEPEAGPEAGPEAAPTLPPRPEPQLQPEPHPDGQEEERQPEPPPAPAEPEPVPPGDLGDLSVELRALQETARKADALAVTVGRRIEELEGAGERAQRLEQELAAAQERIAMLEQRLSGVDTAAAELRETTAKLEALYRTLEESAI
jgi:MshEN domain